MIKTLLIAPRHESLPTAMIDSEINEILTSGLSVSPVMGTVDSERFLRSITANGHRILFLLTHGKEEGIMLSDGILPVSLFVQAVRDRFDLVFLNTCDSLSVAQMIQNECATGVICTIDDVNEKVAYYTGSQLAKELSRGLNFYDAYKRARPGGNQTYVFLAGKMGGNQVSRELIKEIVAEEMEPYMETLERIHQEIVRVREREEKDGFFVPEIYLRYIIAIMGVTGIAVVIGLIVLLARVWT